MKIKTRAIYMLICFLFVSAYGYGQLNQFLIGSYWYENVVDTRTEVQPVEFSTSANRNAYFKNLVNHGINTLLECKYSTHSFEAETVLGLNVIPEDENNISDSNRMGFALTDEPTPDYPGYTFQLDDKPTISSLIPFANNVRNQNPSLLIWNNLLPSWAWADKFKQFDFVYNEYYIQDYINKLHPNVLSFDDYPVWYKNETPNTFFISLYGMGSKSVINSIPFFYVMTPMRNFNGGDWLNNETESYSEFKYCIYTALAYGAKGIGYWPGFDWVWDHGVAKQSPAKYSLETLNILDFQHQKFTVNSNLLLNMNFASAYHFNDISTITRPKAPFVGQQGWTYENIYLCENESSAGLKSLQSTCHLPGVGIANDYFAKYVFSDPANAIQSLSGDKNYMISFMTDNNNNIYFWVVYKVVNGINDNFQLKLNDATVTVTPMMGDYGGGEYSSTKSFFIGCGEGKLFKVNKKDPNKLINITLTNETYQSGVIYPLVTADNLTINNTTFQTGSYSSFMAHDIHLGKGTHLMAGSHVHLKKYTDSNTIPSGVAKVGKQSVEDGESGEIKKKEEAASNTVSVFPNPTHSDFKVAMTLQEGESTVISVYDSMGKLVKTQVAAGAETTISIADFPAGVYVVRFNADGKEHHYKVVKM
jgi:Secretion system C-terminal sorting domain